MYSIDDLKTFVIIAETGGVTTGARRLGISPATASHRLAKLEAALQLTLFLRNSRVLRLTDEGQVFFERVQPILADLSQAERDAGSGAAALSGHLRVTMSPWILSRFIMPALPDFQQRHPKLTFEFLTVDRYVSLVAEGQDCAIRVGQLQDSSLVARKLSENDRIICCSPDFAAQHGPFDYAQDLEEAPWVSLPWQRRIPVKDSMGRRRDLTTPSSVLVSNSDMLTDGAVKGLGLAIKSRLAVRDELNDGRLIEVAADCLWEPSAPIWFVFSPETRAGQKTKLFGDLAMQAFNALRPGGKTGS
ncbi:DNA-binding transcriptional LysR family regulator [Roseibium hamelinense]|uniref:DNA-binding transcriptional LysR family regulator n=1 Tax=Roseibium hamelinense TaxID=150831 RepID=A0A562STU0_9HYPH|nr:LysR family transcriptional regulator [Roseibium hamelinense]MTI43162.1 LysR family transcriptional regulator [Roseibium hamelinense]TWI84789.1 DNA-binding transcriptional LysR family regulator [Roseibium hamelinense]